MSKLHTDFMDEGLDGIKTIADATNMHLHICSSDPADRAAAITASLGEAEDHGITSVSGGVVTVPAVSGEDVDATGSASFWALTEEVGSTRLIATGPISGTPTVTSGNTFDLTSFTITINAPS